MQAGVRVAGTAEFAGLESAPNYARARRFAGQAKKLFPQLNCADPDEWMGSGPSFRDSLPCLRAMAGVKNSFAAFGQAHDGFGLAAATSEIIANCITKNIDHETLLPYSITRFQ